MIDFLQQIDSELLLFLNSFHNNFLDSFMMVATGKYIWIPFYVALVYHLFYRYGWRRGLTWLVMISLAIALADQLCATLVRPIAERMRPSNPDNPISQFVHIVNGYRGGRYGFPSCHGANSMALAFMIWVLLPSKKFRICVGCWFFVNVYSRIYLGVHYPGDILIGSLMGVISAITLLKMGKLIENKFHLTSFKPRPYTMLLNLKLPGIEGNISNSLMSGVLAFGWLAFILTLIGISIYSI